MAVPLNGPVRAPRENRESLDSMLLKRNIPVLLRGIGIALSIEHAQRRDYFLARVLGLDDFVDEAVLGGDVGVREFLSELFHFFLALFVDRKRPDRG